MSLANNKILKSAWTEFIYNGHLQSLGAVAIVFASITLVLNTLPTLDILVAAYCIFQVIFVYDRYRDLKIDSSTNKIRTDHLKKHYSKIPYELGLISVVGLIVILYYSNPLTLVISITIVLLGILYTFKIKDITKRLLMFKNVYVSAVFAIMVLYPYLFYGIYALPNPILIYLIVLVFVESMVSQVLLDIKDIKSDRNTGLLTLPARIGKNKTISFVRFSSFIFEAALLYFAVTLGLDVALIILVLINILLNQVLIRFILKDRKTGYFLAAGKFSLWLVFLLLLFFIK